jgi:hypothetical protein
MKLAQMVVRVPIDDAVPIATLLHHLRATLEQRGTEVLQLKQAGANGETPPEPELPGGELPRTGRVHWPAAECVMLQERSAPTPPAAKGKGKGNATTAS